MPLYKDFSTENTQIYLWKYTDDENLDMQLIEPENFDKVKNYHPKKLSEMLMIRKILKEKLPNHKILYKDRAPYLSPKTQEISISHSFPFAVLAFSRFKIGVDIERYNEKIIKLKDKFIKTEEQNFIPKDKENQYLTIIWSIKESLYKLHHSKHWSLKKHYEVFPFSEADFENIKCRVYDEETSDEFTAKVHFFEDFVLTVVVERAL